MPTTITSYNTFTAGTKARATQVNTNFNNYRGTLIPIHPSLPSATTLSYDLGTTEYRWDSYYGRVINLVGMTSTVNLDIYRDNTATLGAYKFGIGSVTAATLKPSGFTRTSIETIAFTTGVSPVGGTGTLVQVDGTNLNYMLNTSANLSICSARIGNRAGGVLQVSVYAQRISISRLTTTAITFYDARVRLYRGATTTSMVAIQDIINQAFAITSTWAAPDFNGHFGFTIFDTSAPSGEVVYSLEYLGGVGNSPTGFAANVNFARMSIKEA